MAATSAMVWNPDMKATYERLRARGKPHRVAIVAVMRRLIILANALLRDRRTWVERAPA
jgi:transposase